MPADVHLLSTALQKRIRRRVVARSWEFFASTPPGFEKLCKKECKALLFFEQTPRNVVGGLGFNGRIHLAYRANLHLRTANRVLMRIEEFKATNFRRLRKKLKELAWELFVMPKSPVSFRISSAGSRLFHTKAVEQCAREAFDISPVRQNFLTDTERNASPQIFFIRIKDDNVCLSLDASGENLYKRGLKIAGAKAPLRETAAAAVLMLLGYDGTCTLLDPMCGSGTFSLEAAMIGQGIPPGWYRSFPFFHWPCFSPGKWRHIRKQSKKNFRLMSEPSIFASDIDPETCQKLRDCVWKAGFQNAVEIKGGLDFFDLLPQKFTNQCGAVVLNPPYGLRMDTPEKNSENFFDEIFRKLKSDFRGWKAAVIVPDFRASAGAPSNFRRMRLFHGGLYLHLVYGNVPL